MYRLYIHIYRLTHRHPSGSRTRQWYQLASRVPAHHGAAGLCGAHSEHLQLAHTYAAPAPAPTA